MVLSNRARTTFPLVIKQDVIATAALHRHGCAINKNTRENARRALLFLKSALRQRVVEIHFQSLQKGKKIWYAD